MQEVEVHIENLKATFGEFRYAPYRTLFSPNEELLQLSIMLPKYKPYSNVTPRIAPKIESETKALKLRIKQNVESESEDDSSLKDIKSEREHKPKINEIDKSEVTPNDERETHNTPPTSSSQSSLNSDDHLTSKSGIKCTIAEFDKFVEGYGTEDELVDELNLEARTKIITYNSDSDDESAPLSESPGGPKSADDDDTDKMSVSSSDMSTVRGGKCRTRGGYQNVSGKVKIICGRKSEEFDNGRKRLANGSPEIPTKVSRLSEEIYKSENEKIDTSKINSIDELPESGEFSFKNVFDDVQPINFNEKSNDDAKSEFVSSLEHCDIDKMKPVTHVDIGELYNSNKDLRISPASKAESMTDKLIKRMSISQSESEKAEIVKRQILDSLEATSSTLFTDLEKENEDNLKTDSSLQDVNNTHNKDTTENGEKVKSLSERDKIENRTEKAAADSSFSPDDKSSNEESDSDHFLHVTTVKKSYGPSAKAVLKENQKSDSLPSTSKMTEVEMENMTTEGLKKHKQQENFNEEVHDKTHIEKSNEYRQEETLEKVSTTVNKKTEDNNAKNPSEKTVITKSTDNEGIKTNEKRKKEVLGKRRKSDEKSNQKPVEKITEKVEGTSNTNSEGNTEVNSEIPKITKTVQPDSLEPKDKNLEKFITIRKISKGGKQIIKKIRSSKEMEVEEDEEEDEESAESVESNDEDYNPATNKAPNPVKQQLQKQFLKIVNVGDIISGKIDSSISDNTTIKKSEKKKVETKQTEVNDVMELEHDAVEIKSEPLSESEESDVTDKSILERTSYDVTLSIVEKEKKKTDIPITSKIQFKVVDNLTRVIDSVAKNTLGNEISLRPISKLQSPKQKARKTFPSISKTIQIKKITTEKKDINEASQKTVSTVQVSQSAPQSIPPPPCVVNTTSEIPPVPSVSQAPAQSTSTTNVNKESLVYVAQPQAPVVLPPNQPISLAAAGGGSPLLAVVQHPTLTNTGFVINTNQPIAIPISQPAPCNVTPSIAAITTATPNIASNSNGITEDISTLVGEIMTVKAPPKLKPKPPGPLSTYFDEGVPSSAGPVTKTINSVAHRLTDYFRGLLSESLQDLNVAGSPEAKIRSLELEVESLKYKHQEEMQEFKKNITIVLKDIQKSFAEEKHKIIDETRATCEAERLRSVEEAKSKQW